MSKPNLKDFLKENPNMQFSEEQKKLADALINYRVAHFSMARRAGRTTVVNAVKSYFSKFYPVESGSTREI